MLFDWQTYVVGGRNGGVGVSSVGGGGRVLGLGQTQQGSKQNLNRQDRTLKTFVKKVESQLTRSR